MCVGLALFTVADSSMSPNFDSYGVLMISLALVCDAAIGNVQEKAMKAYKAPNSEVVFFSYGIGFVYLLLIMTSSGHLFSGIKFCSHVSGEMAHFDGGDIDTTASIILAHLGHVRPRVPVQPVRLSGHPDRINSGQNLWRHIGCHRNDGPQGSHNRHLVPVLLQTVFRPVSSL